MPAIEACVATARGPVRPKARLFLEGRGQPVPRHAVGEDESSALFSGQMFLEIDAEICSNFYPHLFKRFALDVTANGLYYI